MYNVGIIGLGGMGQKMLADMVAHDSFAVTAIWDPDTAAANTVVAEYPGLKISTNADELIADPDVDLVYVASPPQSHRGYFLSAIESKTPVYCEKPFGVNVTESADLLAQIERAELPHVLNFNHGNARGSTHIEEQITSGAMGDVVGIEIAVHLNQWPRAFQESATWLAKREQGGFTREMLSHWLYLSRRLLGEGKIVHAHVKFPADGTSAETHLMAELDFSGIPVFIRAATGGAGPVGTEYTVRGSKMSYRLHSGGRISASDGGPWTEQFTEIADIDDKDRQRTLDGVAGRLRGEDINMPTARDGFEVQKLVEQLLAADE